MRALVLVVAVLVVTLVVGSPAQATFGSRASSTQLLSTAGLAPPTNPTTAAGSCTIGGSASIVVSWTATVSAWAEGYEVLRSTASGGPYSVVATVSGRSVTSYTNRNLAFSTTYYYVVKATKALWRSVPTAVVSRRTPSSLCL
jgi:hypothetical protein